MKIIQNNMTFFFILLLISSCKIQDRDVDLSNFKTFFSSLNEINIDINKNKEINIQDGILKKNSKVIVPSEKNNLQKNSSNFLLNDRNNNLKKTKKVMIKTDSIIDLKNQIGMNDIKLLELIGKPDLTIRKGKVKVTQFHFKECYLDLFFVLNNSSYFLDHFEYRSPIMLKDFNIEKCKKEVVKKINSKYRPN